MVEYDKVIDKLSNTQLKNLKSAIKNKTGTTLRINLKMLNGSNLPHDILLTARQKTKLRNAFNNNMSTDLKLYKSQISKIIQPGGFLGSSLSKLAGSLMKIANPLSKHVLAPLGITAAASAIDAGTYKKITKTIYGSVNTTLIIPNEIIKIIQALENSNIVIKGVTKTIKMETKEQKGGSLSMLLGTLRASLLGNLLTGKGILRAGSLNKKGKGIVRAGTGKEWDFKCRLIL